MPLPESVGLELEAIDAALAGEPVDPEFAELAELALLLADSRPEIPEPVARDLDRRISALASATPRGARGAWILRPAWGAGLAAVAAVAVVVVVLAAQGGGGGSRSGPDVSQSLSAGGSAVRPAAGPTAQATSSSGSAGGSNHVKAAAASPTATQGGQYGPATTASAPAPASAGAAASSPASVSRSAPLGALGAVSAVAVPTPDAGGRRIVQSAQLTLTAPSARIATVSQELFNVVGAEQGIVKHSSVSTGVGGYATFTLSIPTPNLSVTLARIAQLRYATVASSTASTTDVNSQYLNDQRALKDAKALRLALLKQLQAAYSTTAIDSLKAQIQAAEASIASDERSLTGLQSRISYTAVSVQIEPGTRVLRRPPVPAAGGFTLRRAGHDALRVLTVSAGVALITLAVLVPVGLALALVAWLGFGWRRRRRESVLDAA